MAVYFLMKHLIKKTFALIAKQQEFHKTVSREVLAKIFVCTKVWHVFRTLVQKYLYLHKYYLEKVGDMSSQPGGPKPFHNR